MPVKSCSLHINAHNQEIEKRGTPLFQCGAYTTYVGNQVNRGIPWHWHEEVEVLVVCSGTILLEIAGHHYHIAAGEGAFINSGVLHSAIAVEALGCEVHSFVFHPRLIAGAAESIFEHRYINPLVKFTDLPTIHFGKEIAWHKIAILCILEAFKFYQKEAFGYELLVREKLSHLWFLIVSHYQNVLVQPTALLLDALRIKNMLNFIHTNYINQIILADIAKVASLSKRECLRCFHRTIGVTPMRYLLQYRISVSTGLLATTDASITEICKQSGFESPSYFSAVFKKLMDTTPRDYRRSISNACSEN